MLGLCQHLLISPKGAKMKPVTVTYKWGKHYFMARVTKHPQGYRLRCSRHLMLKGSKNHNAGKTERLERYLRGEWSRLWNK